MTESCLKCSLYTEFIRITAFFNFQPLTLGRVFPQIGNYMYLKSRVTSTAGDIVKCWTVLSLLMKMGVKLSLESSYIRTVSPINPQWFFHSWENKMGNNILAIFRYTVGHTQTNSKWVTAHSKAGTAVIHVCNRVTSNSSIFLWNIN